MVRFKVGDEAILPDGRKVEVIEISLNPKEMYPIRVRLDNGERWWCKEKYLKAVYNLYPNLF